MGGCQRFWWQTGWKFPQHGSPITLHFLLYCLNIQRADVFLCTDVKTHSTLLEKITCTLQYLPRWLIGVLTLDEMIHGKWSQRWMLCMQLMSSWKATQNHNILGIDLHSNYTKQKLNTNSILQQWLSTQYNLWMDVLVSYLDLE